MTAETKLINLFEGFVDYEGIYLKSSPSVELLKRAENDTVEFWLKHCALLGNLQIFSTGEVKEAAGQDEWLRNYLRQSIQKDPETLNRLTAKWGSEIMQAWLAG